MKLYVFPVAPNPTRVRLYLAKKRAGGAQIEIDEGASICARASNARPDAERHAHRTRNTLAAALQFGRFGGVAIDGSREQIACWDRAYRDRDGAKTVLVP